VVIKATSLRIAANAGPYFSSQKAVREVKTYFRGQDFAISHFPAASAL
jgi:hypothetical protein